MLHYKDIVLRPIREADLADYHIWETTETEWTNWDGPWEAPFAPGEFVAMMQARIAKEAASPPDVYTRLEIQANEGHIGWVSRYDMDDDPAKIALGIDIPPMNARGKGYGEQAFVLWTGYLFARLGAAGLYTQTWSGNLPMLRLAQKVGFTECRRIKDAREVRGAKYDALSFFVTRADFVMKYGEIVV